MTTFLILLSLWCLLGIVTWATLMWKTREAGIGIIDFFLLIITIIFGGFIFFNGLVSGLFNKNWPEDDKSTSDYE